MGCGGDPSAPSQLKDLTLKFCDPLPAWVAYQNEGGNWTRVTSNGGVYSFQASEKVAVAATWLMGQDASTAVVFASFAELAPLGDITCLPMTGNASHRGSITGIAVGPDQARVSMATASTVLFASGSFTLTGLPNRQLDLIGQREGPTQDGNIIPTWVDVRRAVSPGSMNLAPLGEVGSAWPFDAVAINVSGRSPSDVRGMRVEFVSKEGTHHQVADLLAYQVEYAIPSVPGFLAAPEDLHTADIYEIAQGGMSGRGTVVRFRRKQDLLDPLSLLLGAALSSPTIQATGTSSFARYRVSLPYQQQYGEWIVATILQPTQSGDVGMSMTASKAYFTQAPTTWIVETPELESVTGFPSAAALHADQASDWFVEAHGSSFAEAPTDIYAWRASTAQIFVSSTVIGEPKRRTRAIPPSRTRLWFRNSRSSY